MSLWTTISWAVISLLQWLHSILSPGFLASIRRSLIITNKHFSEISTLSPPLYFPFTQNMAQRQTRWLWLLTYSCCSCVFQLETETDIDFGANLYPPAICPPSAAELVQSHVRRGWNGGEWFGVAHQAPCGACLLIAMWHLHKASSGTARAAAAAAAFKQERQLTAGLFLTCARYRHSLTQSFYEIAVLRATDHLFGKGVDHTLLWLNG